MERTKVKVVLIEDSALMRIMVSEIIRKDEELSLVATAVNGKDGIQKILALKPDVVVTDMIMPDYDGVYVVKELMRSLARPVILLSSLDRNANEVFEALNAGAFDFIEKPSEQSSLSGYRLNALIKAAATSGGSALVQRTSNFFPHTFDQELLYDVVVIGSSTGGPGAVETVLDNLPKNLTVPVVVAQHMPAHFIQTFAERLDSKKILRVKIAEEGEYPEGGSVYLAAGTSNLQIVKATNGKIMFRYTDKLYKEFNFPSVDCLFESVAEACGARAIGVILTGMGRDGTEGLRKMSEAGSLTIGQDESSSVVYGMPKSAFEAGVITQVLNLKEIPGYVVSCLS
jgi:two-component system chemotaxis response regulator CheB